MGFYGLFEELPVAHSTKDVDYADLNMYYTIWMGYWMHVLEVWDWTPKLSVQTQPTYMYSIHTKVYVFVQVDTSPSFSFAFSWGGPISHCLSSLGHRGGTWATNDPSSPEKQEIKSIKPSLQQKLNLAYSSNSNIHSTAFSLFVFYGLFRGFWRTLNVLWMSQWVPLRPFLVRGWRGNCGRARCHRPPMETACSWYADEARESTL